MELFEVLKKRRMIRHFKQEALSDEVLSRLIYAGHRASTGSNSPHRRLMLVRDPKLLRLLRTVAPGQAGYIVGKSQPAALIVVYTDLNANKMGDATHAPMTSKYDAGIAAGFVHLAAVDLGLGSCIFTSVSTEGVKELLGMPEHCRPEVLVSLGYPVDDLPRGRRAPPESRLVYQDRFGKEWSGVGRGTAK